jgi:hypothetical protein
MFLMKAVVPDVIKHELNASSVKAVDVMQSFTVHSMPFSVNLRNVQTCSVYID